MYDVAAVYPHSTLKGTSNLITTLAGKKNLDEYPYGNYYVQCAVAYLTGSTIDVASIFVL